MSDTFIDCNIQLIKKSDFKHKNVLFIWQKFI